MSNDNKTYLNTSNLLKILECIVKQPIYYKKFKSYILRVIL
jgi:hypothetical protein